MTSTTRLFAVGAALAVGIGAVAAAPAGATTPDLHAAIHGSAAHPSVRGGASYQADHGMHELSLHLRGASDLAGHRLVVSVHGDRVGAMTVTSTGTAHLDRHHGVPGCAAGDRVRVRAAGGDLVGAGILRHLVRHDGDHDGDHDGHRATSAR